MSEGGQAVFLSYASQDAAAAAQLCAALRAAGVEVWFDQNELVGGDAWDAKIRRQIAECALFVPVISANTQARTEGYFRLEWKLAAQRTHMIADDATFLLPVAIDTTRDADARVPAEFKAVQWTRLPDGGQSAGFAARVKTLLDRGAVAPLPPAVSTLGPAPRSGADPGGPPRPRWLIGAVATLGVLLTAGAWWWQTRTAAPPPTTTRQAPPPAASPVDALVAKARALLDDDPLMTRANVGLAEQLALEAVAKDQTNAEAHAAAAWANFRFVGERYDDTPQRRANLHSFAEKARLLAPDSVNAELAVCGDLFATGNRVEAQRRLHALVARAPGNFTVLRQRVWAEVWGSHDAWGPAGGKDPEMLTKLRAFSPLGRTYADSFKASRHWVRGEYGEADRLMDGVFAAGQPVRMSYLVRLLVLLYGWGDLAAARDFVATIPAKLLLEDVFIAHVTNVWLYSGEYDRALATLDRTQREFLQEALIFSPVASLRGKVLAAAGRPSAAAIQWKEALRLVDQRLAAHPGHVTLLEEKARVLVHLGDRAGAAAAYALANEIAHPAAGSIAWAEDYDYFALIGDPEAAISRIDRLLAPDNGRWPNIYNALRHEPTLAALRRDPRVQLLLARGAQRLAELKAGGATAARPDDKSVAVLAFANLSDDKANEYFSDGISEELLNVLAKVPGLKVSARTSAFSFKGKNTPIPEIAQQLGVAYVVEGSVRKAGDKVRITAQLIKAADGFHVWSDTFTRDLKDIFAVQDEIAGLIAKNLSLKLGADPATATAGAAVNPDAYRLYLEGRAAWNRRDAEGYRQAEQLLNRAIKLEPRFARAHAALADVWAVRSFPLSGTFSQRHSPLLARTIAKAEQAVALDENSAEAHASLGHSLGQAWRFPEALRALRRAIELNPNYASAHQWLGRALLAQGRLDEGLAALQRAAELDPLSHRILDNYSDALKHTGRPGEAWAVLRRAASLQPSGVQIRCKQTAILATLGRRDEALAAARALAADAEAEEPDYRYSTAIGVLCAFGETAEAEALIARIAPNSEDLPIALVYAGRVREFVQRLDEMTINWMENLWFDPSFASIRADPDFRAWVKKVGLTDAQARSDAWLAAHPPEKPGAKP
ncbi:MAG: TIR domain-containing protein [Verrucomicrobia bacterium]|nr:TIR domain-containing protein [Verrucomicrobiota bacterium]